MVINELIEIWADYAPVAGYAAGLDSCKGKIFIPTDYALRDIKRRSDAARDKLNGITETDLRYACGKFLNCINRDLKFIRPDQQINRCAEGLWFILIKSDHLEGFVATYLENAEKVIESDLRVWKGRTFTVETSRACFNSAEFLLATLTILKSLNTGVSAQIDSVSSQVAEYKSVFHVEGINTNKFCELFKLFESRTKGPSKTDGYEAMLDELYDYGMTAEEIASESRHLLDEELMVVRVLAERIAEQLSLPTNSDLEKVYAAMGECYDVSGDTIGIAQGMMKVINEFTAESLQDLSPGEFVVPEEAPPFLSPLITSGATVVLDNLTAKPLGKVYLTAKSNVSWLTMLNVLVHEGVHAYQGVMSPRSATSPLLKLMTHLSIPLSEGMAFYREWEIYVAVIGILRASNPSPVQQEMLNLFGSSDPERQRRATAFEMETRIWRVIRLLRAVCDVEVNLGNQSYVDFIKWASSYTGLGRNFIHDQCFTFLANPGYAPSYAICGTIYGRLQEEKIKQGLPKKSFNTQACSMGFYPWSICVDKMRAFQPKGVLHH